MKYVTDSKVELDMDRVNDDKIYDTKKKLRDTFEVVSEASKSLCGNVRVGFVRSKAKIVDIGTLDYNKNMTPDYEQISSALALYRTISLFECGLNASTCDFYKMNWKVILKHKPTGDYLVLGEWKGGFQIFTAGHSVKGLSKAFIKDAEKLLTFLVSDSFTIGYDGVVAGSVA